jgi:hypothetical protein
MGLVDRFKKIGAVLSARCLTSSPTRAPRGGEHQQAPAVPPMSNDLGRIGRQQFPQLQ